MLRFLRRLRRSRTAPSAPPPEEVLACLSSMTSDAVIEDVWEGMDRCAADIFDEVRERVRARSLGAYPLQAATIWLAYHCADSRIEVEPWLSDRLEEAVTWGLQFEQNNVLVGGALHALDAVGPSEREAIAIAVFDALGHDSSRRYWLLLKVRSDAFVARVVDALDDFGRRHPPLEPTDDPESAAHLERLKAHEPRRRMAGAFRHFGEDDADVLLRHFSLENAGADLLVEALASTGAQRVVGVLEDAANDSRPAVRRAAESALATHFGVGE